MEDLISRQAVLEMAYDMSEIDGEHFTEPCMVVDVEDIQKLPSVKPQKSGEWIESDSDDPCWYMCSKCHRQSDVKENYCPNCGADMRGDT